MEIICQNELFKEWKALEYFFVDSISALNKDSRDTSHPISVYVEDPSVIDSIFDTITYIKVKLDI